MQQKQYSVAIILFAFIISLTACPVPPEYPIEPFLEMQQVILTDTIDALENPIKRATIVFKLIDGDGNIGLKESDTIGTFHPDSQFHYNCFAEMYRIDDGDTTDAGLQLPLQYRVPYIEPAGENKNLLADVFIDIDITIGNQPPDYDTVFYELYIYDRDFNKSNIIQSPAVPFHTTGIYVSHY